MIGDFFRLLFICIEQNYRSGLMVRFKLHYRLISCNVDVDNMLRDGEYFG